LPEGQSYLANHNALRELLNGKPEKQQRKAEETDETQRLRLRLLSM
jgi:hypothetical protein